MSSSFAATSIPETFSDRDSTLRRVLTPKPYFMLTRVNEEGRSCVEAFVAGKFQHTWQARVSSFMPWLLSMHCVGHCSAVAGIRSAAKEHLFLERYLDQSIDDALSSVLGILPVST